jgi:hypothetical protein
MKVSDFNYIVWSMVELPLTVKTHVMGRIKMQEPGQGCQALVGILWS